MNNLTELNEILFQTLRDVKDDKIDIKKAQSITNVSNSIIQNAKTQLQAYKLTNGNASVDAFIEVSENQSKQLPEKLYEQKLQFSKESGYKSLGEALAQLGKTEFEKQFKAWSTC